MPQSALRRSGSRPFRRSACGPQVSGTSTHETATAHVSRKCAGSRKEEVGQGERKSGCFLGLGAIRMPKPEETAEPKKRFGPKRSEPPAAAPVRRQRDSAGDQVTQKAKKPKGEATCKKKSKLE